jgi:hypothetical protein
MKLQVVLALLLLAVAAFAVDTDATGDTREMAMTAEDGMIMVTMEGDDSMQESSDGSADPDEQVMTAPVAPQLISAQDPDEGRYGSCTIEVGEDVDGADVKQVSIRCDLELPTPCHSVSYGWVPGREEGQYVFSVQVQERPGICTQVLKETSITDEALFKAGKELEFSYKINYISAPVVTSTSTVAMPEPTPVESRVCENTRDQLKLNIERLEGQLAQLDETSDALEVTQFRRRLAELKEQLDNLDCNRELVEKELPSAALCFSERLEVEYQLQKLQLALSEAETAGDTETISALQERIRVVKAELEELPTVARCAQSATELQSETVAIEARAEKLQEYSERLKEFNLALRLVNPCDKVGYIEGRINGLEGELQGVTDEEAAAIKEKIGVLADIRNTMNKACEELKNNTDCRDALRLREEFRQIMDSLESGEDPARVRERARLLLEKFGQLERACLTSVKEMMDNHPCMAAGALEVELERLSAEGEDSELLAGIYRQIDAYKQECVEGAKLEQVRAQVQSEVASQAGPVSDRASDVARVVGELELRKHLLLMDDSLTDEQKSQKIAVLEQEKLGLIKEAITNMKQARLSSAMNVKFGPDKLEIDGEAMDEEDVTLELPTAGNETLQVDFSADGVQMGNQKLKIRASAELNFEDGVLTVNGQSIQLPEQFMERVRVESGDLELKEENGQAVYEGNVEKEYRLFAIVPLKAQVRLKANATDGTILEMQRPWWAAFAVE